MNASILAARAIVAVFIRRTFGIIAMIAGGILLALSFATAYASVELSLFWLVFFVPLLALAIFAALIVVIIWLLTDVLSPRKLTRGERKEITTFTNRLTIAAGSAQVSRITLAYLLVKDAIRGRHLSERLSDIIGEGKGLQADFRRIRKLFE